MTTPATAATHDWRPILKRRVVIVAVLLALWVTGIEAKLVYLQIFQRADLAARAERQQERTLPSPAKRGDIVDRRGRVLATSVDADTIYAVPTEVDNAADAAERICGALGDCDAKDRQSIAEKLGQQRAFAYVKRQVSPDQAQRVAALNLDGIGFMKESKRFYPNKELAAHLLGWVGIDNKGLSGLEYTYDPQIRGKAGTISVHTDARRHAFSRFERPPTAGSSVELTIDEYLQHIAERELHAGVTQNRAAGGTAIIMNPHTGEILAMANEPTFNPNAYRDSSETERRNRAVQDLYEPGSTFKVVTASAAIEEKVMPIDTMIDTNPGVIHIAGRPKPITEASHHNYGVLSFEDVIVKSSNIGAIKIGLRVGTERLSKYVGLYGFGHPVSPDFPGESPGIVWNPSKWTESALASVSMGYQVGVTPLQMVTAISSVANGGELIEPRVIRAVYRDGRRYAVQPKIVRRTISADTAATLTGIMEGVVDRGTAKLAQMPGFTVAGKTGTAAKLVNGRYSTSDYNASFVGFVPSRNPVIAIIVVTDSPHAGLNTGGPVSGPVFKRIAEATLQYLGVPPTINPAAPVLVARQNSGSPSQTSVDASEPIVSLVADGPPGTVPDLRGMSAREAVRKLVKLGMNARVSGDGSV
ncbi:MAG TPA: penicillin-binding transpeptidase domain-containing protein, partial [Vicinamibacterales bacterium]|nr:penicillin-binding transpeptidase domain-containing protein [Vicinamibacterales bacterium]